MRKMKTVLLLVALLAFSSELFAENNVTDSNVSLSSNDAEIDDWDDDGEELDFEALKEAQAKNKAEGTWEEIQAENKEAHAQNEEAHKRKEQLENILLGS